MQIRVHIFARASHRSNLVMTIKLVLLICPTDQGLMRACKICSMFTFTKMPLVAG